MNDQPNSEQAKQELLDVLAQQLQATKNGFTSSGKQLYYQSKAWEVPSSDVLTKWLDANWPAIEATGKALLVPPFSFMEVMNVIDQSVTLVQSLKAAGIPGLARGDVAASLAKWVVTKYAPAALRGTWYGTLLTDTLLPVLVKAAWSAKFSN